MLEKYGAKTSKEMGTSSTEEEMSHDTEEKSYSCGMTAPGLDNDDAMSVSGQESSEDMD